uniref:Uncharacterized protein n=1 Tax=Arundo donax TaxID=35708 RepID=A0A0A9GA80_ARUDO
MLTLTISRNRYRICTFLW